MDELSPIDEQLLQCGWLDAYREIPTIEHACKKANVSRAMVKKWKEDPAFLLEIADADAEANEKVEGRMFCIAMGLVKKPLLDRQGKQITISSEDGVQVEPGWEVIRSDAITLAVAKARMPEKYADAAEFNLSDLSQEELTALGLEFRKKTKGKK